MELNKNIKLFHKNVHHYDIEACHYTILKNHGFDMSNIDKEDKLKRNIQIGQMMKVNERVTYLLRTTTESIINEYINANKINDDQIIIRQYDGLILTKTLRNTEIGSIPLERRSTYQIFLISFDRKKYIALDNNLDIIIKGIPFRYQAMDDIYKQLCRICEMNKDSIFTNLQKIKDKILYSTDTQLYGIPTKNNKFIVYLKEYGEVEITKTLLRIMDTEDIDKQKYFDFYIKPFTKSIVLEFVRGNK